MTRPHGSDGSDWFWNYSELLYPVPRFQMPNLGTGTGHGSGTLEPLTTWASSHLLQVEPPDLESGGPSPAEHRHHARKQGVL